MQARQRVAKAASISSFAATFTTSSRNPLSPAACCASRPAPSRLELRIYQQGDHLRLGDQFGRQLDSLSNQFEAEDADAGDVAAGPGETGNQAVLAGSAARHKTIGIVEVHSWRPALCSCRRRSRSSRPCAPTRSEAKSGSRSYWPSAQRYSIASSGPRRSRPRAVLRAARPSAVWSGPRIGCGAGRSLASGSAAREAGAATARPNRRRT